MPTRVGEPTDHERERSHRHGWWLLALVVALGASFPLLSRMMNANERPRLLQAVALVDHGTWALDPVVAGGIDAGIDVSRAPPELGGRLYPNKPPGATVPAVVAYAIQRAWCGMTGEVPTLRGLTLLARLLGALLPIVVLAELARRRLGGDGIAVLAVTLTVLATPLHGYAHVLFGHGLAALTLFTGTAAIADAITAPTEDREALRRAGLGGALAGATVLVEYAAVFAGLPIAIALLVHARRGRLATTLAALVGALVPIGLLALYHQQVFGSPLATGYHHVVDAGFAELHGRGLLGLSWPQAGDVVEDLFSPWGGLLYFAPLVVLAVWAWSLAPTHERVHVRLQLAVLATLVLATLCIAQAGGWRVGPRYLVAALPALAPALAVVLRARGDRENVLAVLLGLAGWSLVVNALAANLFPALIPTGNPLRDQLVPLLVAGHQPYTMLDGFRGAVPFSVWLPLLVTLALFVLAARAVVPVALRMRVLVGALVIAGAIGIAAWSVPPADDAAQSLAAIESIWEPGGAKPPVVKVLRPADD